MNVLCKFNGVGVLGAIIEVSFNGTEGNAYTKEYRLFTHYIKVNVKWPKCTVYYNNNNIPHSVIAKRMLTHNTE